MWNLFDKITVWSLTSDERLSGRMADAIWKYLTADLTPEKDLTMEALKELDNLGSEIVEKAMLPKCVKISAYNLLGIPYGDVWVTKASTEAADAPLQDFLKSCLMSRTNFSKCVCKMLDCGSSMPGLWGDDVLIEYLKGLRGNEKQELFRSLLLRLIKDQSEAGNGSDQNRGRTNQAAAAQRGDSTAQSTAPQVNASTTEPPKMVTQMQTLLELLQPGELEAALSARDTDGLPFFHRALRTCPEGAWLKHVMDSLAKKIDLTSHLMNLRSSLGETVLHAFFHSDDSTNRKTVLGLDDLVSVLTGTKAQVIWGAKDSDGLSCVDHLFVPETNFELLVNVLDSLDKLPKCVLRLLTHASIRGESGTVYHALIRTSLNGMRKFSLSSLKNKYLLIQFTDVRDFEGHTALELLFRLCPSKVALTHFYQVVDQQPEGSRTAWLDQLLSSSSGGLVGLIEDALKRCGETGLVSMPQEALDWLLRQSENQQFLVQLMAGTTSSSSQVYEPMSATVVRFLERASARTCIEYLEAYLRCDLIPDLVKLLSLLKQKAVAVFDLPDIPLRVIADIQELQIPCDIFEVCVALSDSSYAHLALLRLSATKGTKESGFLLKVFEKDPPFLRFPMVVVRHSLHPSLPEYFTARDHFPDYVNYIEMKELYELLLKSLLTTLSPNGEPLKLRATMSLDS